MVKKKEEIDFSEDINGLVSNIVRTRWSEEREKTRQRQSLFMGGGGESPRKSMRQSIRRASLLRQSIIRHTIKNRITATNMWKHKEEPLSVSFSNVQILIIQTIERIKNLVVNYGEYLSSVRYFM